MQLLLCGLVTWLVKKFQQAEISGINILTGAVCLYDLRLQVGLLHLFASFPVDQVNTCQYKAHTYHVKQCYLFAIE